MATTVETAGTASASTTNVVARHINLPPFNQRHIDTWLSQVQIILHSHNIPTPQCFSYIVGALPPDVAANLNDIITVTTSVSDARYQALIARLRSLYAPTLTQRYANMTNPNTHAQRKPSHHLHYLLSQRMGEFANVPQFFIRQTFLNSLPQNVRDILDATFREDGDLEDMAEAADRIMERRAAADTSPSARVDAVLNNQIPQANPQPPFQDPQHMTFMQQPQASVLLPTVYVTRHLSYAINPPQIPNPSQYPTTTTTYSDTTNTCSTYPYLNAATHYPINNETTDTQVDAVGNKDQTHYDTVIQELTAKMDQCLATNRQLQQDLAKQLRQGGAIPRKPADNQRHQYNNYEHYQRTSHTPRFNQQYQQRNTQASANFTQHYSANTRPPFRSNQYPQAGDNNFRQPLRALPAPDTYNNNNNMQRPNGPNNTYLNPNWCWFHQTFRHQSRRCRPPCSFHPENTNRGG